MRAYEVLGVLGLGSMFAAAVACGGGEPDSTNQAQGAATGANAPTGTATGTAAPSASAAAPTTPSSATPKSTAPTPDAGTPTGNGKDGLPGLPGTGDGNGSDCCFNGQYFHCPTQTACLGGFDFDGCLGKCGNDVDCIQTCADQIDDTAAPKGCDANAAPPPGVDCGGGDFFNP